MFMNDAAKCRQNAHVEGSVFSYCKNETKNLETKFE
jgi:hypothetical protein